MAQAQKVGTTAKPKMKIKKGDQVIVLSGKDKGKTGTVTQAMPKDAKVIVGGINTVVRHTKPTQADLANQRMRDYAEHGKHLGPLPPPGVFARHNAVDTPALLPDGSPAPTSLSRVLTARGSTLSPPGSATQVERIGGSDDDTPPRSDQAEGGAGR